jgi:hypothetical protein
VDDESKPIIAPPAGNDNSGKNEKIGISWLQPIFSWPAFAVLMVVVFWTPLRRIGEVVPHLLEASDTITVGKITLQIRQNLKNLESQAGPEVRDALSGMEAEDAMTVLENNLENTQFYSGGLGDDIRRWQRLKRLGVVEELTPAELRKAEKENHEVANHYNYAVRPTAKYDKLHKFLARAVFEIVNSSVTLPTSSKAKE